MVEEVEDWRKVSLRPTVPHVADNTEHILGGHGVGDLVHDEEESRGEDDRHEDANVRARTSHGCHVPRSPASQSADGRKQVCQKSFHRAWAEYNSLELCSLC